MSRTATLLLLMVSVPGLGACDPNAVPAGYSDNLVGRQTCQVYDAFGARLPLRACAAPDRPTYGQYHELPPPRLANGRLVYPAPYAPLPQPGVGGP